MPIRFRRSIKVAPDVKLNLSKSGVSTTVGPRGIHFTFNKHGIRRSIGIPGTGLSEVDYIKKNGSTEEHEKREAAHEHHEENAAENRVAREHSHPAASEPAHESRRAHDGEVTQTASLGLRNAFVLLSIAVFFLAGAAVLGLMPAHFFSNSLQYLAHLMRSAGH